MARARISRPSSRSFASANVCAGGPSPKELGVFIARDEHAIAIRASQPAMTAARRRPAWVGVEPAGGSLGAHDAHAPRHVFRTLDADSLIGETVVLPIRRPGSSVGRAGD